MTYAEAVMLEVFRNSSIVPLSIFHSAMEDVPSFHGYEIPKGTVVMGNLYSVHHDTTTWGEYLNRIKICCRNSKTK
jgi:cytochrome P450